MDWLISLIFIGTITGIIAHKKGYSFFWWFVFGVLLFIVALPWAICLKSKKIKQCPECAESIKEAATICKFCGHEFYINRNTRKQKREILKSKNWGAIDE